MKGSKEKIPMEKYMDFAYSHKQMDLKVHFMHQIIAMHGYKRIIKATKSVLSDALKTLDLMDPSRSTLKENISPCASITLNDIMNDLNDLTWQECCVTSVNTLNNTNTNTNTSQLSKALDDVGRDSSASTSSYFGFEFGEIPTKSVPKKKKLST